MNEEIDESEFYHQDFTTASEWEIFISRLEEVIHEWRVESYKDCNKEHSTKDKWHIQSEKIPFADVEFQLTLYRDKANMPDETTESDDDDDKVSKNPIDTNFDFIIDDGDNSNPDKCLSTWYGLKEFIVLSPLNNAAITSESRVKVLLSSVNIVVANLNCEIPIFVQIREKWQNLYLGIYEGNGIRTNYEMIHLRKSPQHCKYLTGLLDLFKTKIMSPVSLEPIAVSVQLTYHLTDFGKFVWKQELPDVDSDYFDTSTLTVLPFGVSFDPVSCIILKATWSHLSDHLIVDSENYSDFDPMHAQKWTLLAEMATQPACLLAECLTEFLHLVNNSATVYDMLGDYALIPSPDSSNPLDLLTEPNIPTISNVIKRAARNSVTKNRKGVAPLSEDSLVPLLYYLFPDAVEDPSFPYVEKTDKSKDNSTNTFHRENETKLEFLFRGFKTCNRDSLIWRLSIVLAQALDTMGGVRALSHLWFEFVQEMRYRWEKSISIPGLSPGFPDPRTCLLNQKMQMLNCCIERKKARESNVTPTDVVKAHSEDSSTDDEEFFDCDFADKTDEENTKKKEKFSLWNQPVGRLGKFENLKLLKTGDAMYIPITQEPVPKTEDQLEEDTNVLLMLGSDAQGSELRAKMMSASLLSDMESFKAANPGSVLEDFIRWYSPRDWLEDVGHDEWGQRKGHLSSRMLIADNFWVETWNSAKPVPANRQKRLFDDTREAEKVLHFLDSRTLSQICELILPVLSHAAICRLAEECEQIYLTESDEVLRQVIKTIERLSRDGRIAARRVELIIQEIAALELSVSQINSLLYKFNPAGTTDDNLNSFVGNIIAGREVEIENRTDSKMGDRLQTMFSDAQKSANMILTEQGMSETKNPSGSTIFPQATEREFVMRVSASRPAAYSAKCPQFLRAILSKNEFRLVGAFSEDIVFF